MERFTADDADSGCDICIGIVSFLTKGFVAVRWNYSDKVSKNVVWLTYKCLISGRYQGVVSEFARKV